MSPRCAPSPASWPAGPATPPVSEAGVDRALIEDYLLALAGSGRSAATRTAMLVGLKLFLDHGRRHNLLPRLPASAVVYREDLPRREPAVPRFIDEAAMAQLESEQALAQLPDTATRHLVIILIETGLRLGDACLLDFDCVMVDSAGWPCLRYHNSKVTTECLVPLSALAAATIAAQQTHVRSRFPGGSPLLFPRQSANPDGTRPYVGTTLSKRLHDWCQAIGLRDETGQPITVTAHRFRHTLATRMINQGVPVHIVAHYLGHASPQMTNVYAHLHDRTMRAAFEEYCTKRVNIAGQALPYEAESPTTDAEWIKHNLTRVADNLPNGYCGRPPQRDCPHPNACLTCPDFQTTPEFLAVHQTQAATNRTLITLIARAEADGRFRLVTNLQRVQDASTPSSPPSKPSNTTTSNTTTRAMPADNTAHLARAARARTEAARKRATAAIRRLDRDGQDITVGAVARTAAVSRSFLYRHHDLLAEIDRLRHLRAEIRRLTSENHGCANRQKPSSANGEPPHASRAVNREAVPASPAQVPERVGITFELTPGAASDLVIASLLMNLFSELTAAGLATNRITVTIDDYRAIDAA